jgi:hypothetical protein
MLQTLQYITPPHKKYSAAGPSLNSSSAQTAVPSAKLHDKISEEVREITPDKEHDVIMNEVKIEEGGEEVMDVVMSEAAETAEVNGHGNGESSAEVKEEVKVKEENGENNSAHNATTSSLGQITLSGTLGYSSDESARLHAIRGNWKFDHFPPKDAQRFELIRTVPPSEDLTKLPADGEYHGTFSLAWDYKSPKGKMKTQRKNVAESGVMIWFTETDKEGCLLSRGGG